MRDIPGYEGIYAVTEDGRVWVHPRRFGRNKSRFIDGHWIKQKSNSKGYRAVPMCVGGQKFTMLVHRLVAITFIQNPDGLPQINHINGKKNDNRSSNLEWCTGSHNILHAIKNGAFKLRTPEKARTARINAVKARAAAMAKRKGASA